MKSATARPTPAHQPRTAARLRCRAMLSGFSSACLLWIMKPLFPSGSLAMFFLRVAGPANGVNPPDRQGNSAPKYRLTSGSF